FNKVMESALAKMNATLQIKIRTYQQSKLKWTEQMNTDLLECKKKAMEFLKSENLPCHVNGRKKGYIQVMKDLWDKKGYEHLGLKSQNLRDQAARLEKINAAAETRAIGKSKCKFGVLNGTEKAIVVCEQGNKQKKAATGADDGADKPKKRKTTANSNSTSNL
ncbi:Hypothetical predicted protein, partial [Paramuricea clavata]